jgi:hypothetical protein
MLRRWPALVVFLAGATAAAPPAAAAPARHEDSRTLTARELFLAAVEAAQAGDWPAARQLYARSYALKPAPSTLYSLAVAERATGKLVSALAHFRAFLAIDDTPAMKRFREHAERAVIELERRVARVTVVVSPEDDDVELYLDDEAVEAARAREADPGVHTLEVRGRGQRSRILSLRLEPGEHERLKVTLDGGDARPEAEVVTTPSSETPPASAVMPPPVASLVAFGIGSALLSAGVTTGVVGVVRAANVDRQHEADEARRLAIAGDALALSGAGAFAVGLGVWLGEALGGGDDRPDVALGPGSAAFRLRF